MPKNPIRLRVLLSELISNSKFIRDGNFATLKTFSNALDDNNLVSGLFLYRQKYSLSKS